jgi:acyl-CoA synthetase (AMP-forming)/AMP-acid ligase II
MSYLTDKLAQQMHSADRPVVEEAGCWHTAGALRRRIEHIQRMMAAAGIKPGDRVLLGLPNSYAFLCCFLAIIDAGAVVATINPQLTATEFKQFIRRCHPTAAFVLAPHARILLQDDPDRTLRALFTYHDQTIECHERKAGRWASAAQRDESAYAGFAAPAEDAIAVLLYTSGTTGAPKAVGLSHRQIAAAARHIIHSHRLNAADRAYNILPLFHINAQVVTALSTLLSGGQIVMAPKFSASRFWDTIAHEEITWVSAVPAIIAILLKIPRPAVIPETLRFIRSASAPLEERLAVQFEDRFGIPLIQSYGMTEAASQICVNPLPPKMRKLASVGFPYGLQLKIVNDSDESLPCGQPGEIVIRGENVIDHYIDGAGEDAFQNGWFHTGDVGYVDEDGYVYIVGRQKELINRGGEKISPYEVEQVIRMVPGVQQVAVIGLSDPQYGEKVAAFIVTETKDQQVNRQIKQAVARQCRRLLSPQKQPAVIETVDAVPTGPTGKVQRSLLKKRLFV